MNLLGRYIFRQVASALSLILMSLGGVIWIALALKQLDVVTSQGQDALTLVKMTTVALPNLLAIIAPFALLIATLHTLNRLGGDSELIVITASGGNIWRVAVPFLALALIVSLAVAFVNHLAQPWSLQQLKRYILQARTDLLQQVIQPGKFSSPEPHLTFHIRGRALNGELQGLLISDARKPPERQAYLAQTAIVTKQDDIAYLIMNNGHILRQRDHLTAPQIIVFDRYIVNLDSFDRKGPENDFLKPRERYLEQLVRPTDPPQALRRIKRQLRSELHERFSNPFYPIAFVFIALAAAGQAQSTRQARSERLVLAFVAAALLRIVGFAANNLVTIKAAYVPLMYALPAAAIVISAVMMIRNAKPRRSVSVRDLLTDRFAPVFRRLPLPQAGGG